VFFPPKPEFSSMLELFILLADSAEKEQPTAPGWGIFMPLILMFIVFYFFMILPNKRQRQQQEALLSSLKKNDEVLTSAGIIGVVANIKDTGEEVTLKIDENVRMRILRSSIVRILTPREPAKESKSETGTPAKT
jgi:preprotein translocase subunit YajC